MKECSCCGCELEDWDEDICQDCQVSIISNEDVSPNIGDIF